MALIPAAGAGTRLPRSHGSKEALTLHEGGLPVIAHALACARSAGAARAVVLLRSGKGDVREAVRGLPHAPDVEFLEVEPTPSAVHTLATARERVAGHAVLLAFPDLLFEPVSLARDLAARFRTHPADATLALFPSERPDKADMVRLDGRGMPAELVLKQPGCTLEHTWGLAMWGPGFTDLLCETARRPEVAEALGLERELFVGDVLNLALKRGMVLDALPRRGDRILDVGTPGDLERARSRRWEGLTPP